ncbi:MAG: hypothetical protein JF615_02585 [Asticcacaulis sp.]|nr:hypothetical protein [Asticcacaulis sp.]
MTFTQFLYNHWWLIFPVGGMLMGVIGMFSHHHHRNETLKLLKSYADQGKEPPAFLLDALKSDEDRAYDHGYGRRRYYRRYRGYGWGKIAVFAALAVGFGYAGQYAHVENAGIFTALGLAFGVAAAVWAILGLGNLMFGPKARDYDPRDDDDRRDRLDR